MIHYQAELVIDFGDVGYPNSQQRFKVRLDSSPLFELIRDAENAYRVYELLLIDRPGDVWDYVTVVTEDLPGRVADRVRHGLKRPANELEGHAPGSELRMAFTAFDKLFFWSWDDTEPEDQTWLHHRDSETMRTYARQLLALAHTARNELSWSDPLLRHIVAAGRSGDHSFAYLERSVAIRRSGAGKPNHVTHTKAFYTKLGQLLVDPELASVAYRASGDYRILRMLATEQRSRAYRTGHQSGHALHLCAVVNNKTDNDAWDSEIQFFEEGLGHGDLFIEGGGMSGMPIKSLIASFHRLPPGRFILSYQDEGDIDGYDKEAGDGYVSYCKRIPIDRRRGLEFVEWLRGGKLGPIFKFAPHGATVFEYDKTLVVVGAGVDQAARQVLAAAAAEWGFHGGGPVLIVEGDTSPFELAGCRKLFTPPLGGTEDPQSSQEERLFNWVGALMARECHWLDVILALDVPGWMAKALSRQVKRVDGPWKPWVLGNAPTADLELSFVLEGDLASTIESARQLAIRRRPGH